MRHQRACFSAAAILGLTASLATIHISGQSQTTRDVEAAKEAERQLILRVAEGLKKREAAIALPTDVKNWKPGRTPWGDPDVAGVYSNSDESGIPFERPAQFAGRRLEDITPAELDTLRQQRRDAVIDRAASAVEDPEGHPQLFWWENLNASSSRAWLVVDPPDGRIPPTTPEAQKRAAARQEARKRSGRGPADGPEDRSLYDRCISRGLPGSMMPAIYGSSYEIVQGPNMVAITYEMIHETRVIPLDGRPHVSPAIRRYLGDSRGRFDGDTLVVETTNFHPAGNHMGGYFRYADENLRLTERFTRVDDDTLRYEFTVDDPTVWTRPWTAAIYWKKSGGEIYEYACHEGNLSLRGMLSALRAEEAAGADFTKR
jgi:hypothetical protein